MTAPSRIGVVGAGTMGAGIAQLACGAGIETYLQDPVPAALERGAERVRKGLAKWAQRGRMGEGVAREAAGLLKTAPSIDGLAGCDLVIEAAPEDLELKRELFSALSAVCGAETVLATNTSSIPVTQVAGATPQPERVLGMHFFNPPPLMRLVEVIPADQTGERALTLARATAEAMGKRVILASDGPGFLVNRCGRPFYTEALRIVQERLATHEQVDRIVRLGGGFRMGPFELMDLVGIDVGFGVARSFMELSFGEPRWKPSPLQARLVAAGRLGRKSGRGWYDYSDGPYRPDDPEPPALGGGEGRAVAIAGDSVLARELRQRAVAAGFEVLGVEALVRARRTGGTDLPLELVVDARLPGRPPEVSRIDGGGGAGGLVSICAGNSLAVRGDPTAVGFHLLRPLEGSQLVELTRLPSAPDTVATAAERFFTALGFHHEWVGDAPGLVLGRLVCQLVNEAAFAIGEGVGSADDVDAGLTLGLNHPRGPVAWGDAIGLDAVLDTLDGLYEERHEERYRAAPLLRRAATLGLSLRD